MGPRASFNCEHSHNLSLTAYLLIIYSIMFRWVQGIGGCGVLALGQLIFFDILPPTKYVPYTTLVTSVIASSLVTGPLIGGGITVYGSWRWVFLIK